MSENSDDQAKAQQPATPEPPAPAPLAGLPLTGHPALPELPDFEELKERSNLPSKNQLFAAMGFEKVRTVAESAAMGKGLRKKSPRTVLASWKPAADRPDVVKLLQEQGVSRIKELLPIRYERMGVSPFTFYRGNALGMAADLSTMTTCGLEAQICGDAHVANFGMFASPDRHLLFDLNDFDETARGPWEWDMARLAASLEICGRDRSLSAAERTTVVETAVSTYREAMASFAGMGNLDVWYARLDFEEEVRAYVRREEAAAKAKSAEVRKNVKAAEKLVAKAKSKDSVKAMTKLTYLEDGKLRIISQPPLVVPIDELDASVDRRLLAKAMQGVVGAYKKSLSWDRQHLLNRYSYVDCARKVVGVGSVGTRCWIIVLQGRNENDSLVLQVKEAQESVLERYTHRNLFPNHGQRVVVGQQMMQASSDLMLGWVRAPGIDRHPHDFYVRQLWDWKSSYDLDTIQAPRLEELARNCGWTLARAHARSGDRFAISAYLGSGDAFDRSVAEFASNYADINEQDYQCFKDACADGTLPLP